MDLNFRKYLTGFPDGPRQNYTIYAIHNPTLHRESLFWFVSYTSNQQHLLNSLPYNHNYDPNHPLFTFLKYCCQIMDVFQQKLQHLRTKLDGIAPLEKAEVSGWWIGEPCAHLCHSFIAVHNAAFIRGSYTFSCE